MTGGTDFWKVFKDEDWKKKRENKFESEDNHNKKGFSRNCILERKETIKHLAKNKKNSFK